MSAVTDIQGARDGSVVARGLRLHYREHRGADAASLVLLHGLTGNAHEWDPIAAVLSKRFRVVAVDQRGHGKSSWARDYAAGRMVEDLAKIIATLGLDSVAIVGHSMGGMNAYLFAVRYPELVKRLVVVDFGPDSLSPAAAAGWAVALRASGARHTPIRRRPWPNGGSATLVPASASCGTSSSITSSKAGMAAGGGGSMPRAWGASSSRRPPKPPTWSALGRVACPTLLVRGEHSEVLSAGMARRMVQAVPGSRLVELPSGGHDLTVEQPEALATVLDRFLGPEGLGG